jgi:hypothetical protein
VSNVEHADGKHATGTPGSSRAMAFVPIVIDVVVPIVLYFVLRAVGLGEVAAFAVSGVITGVAAVVGTLRKGKLDTIKVLVCFELALSLGLAIAVDDPRIAAVRPSIYLIVAGVYFLFSCVVGRPVLYLMARPMATDGGEYWRTRAYDRAWPSSAPFRRTQRWLTGSIGAVMLLDSIVRVVIVFSYPADQVDTSFLLSNAAGVVMIVLVIGLMVFFVRKGSPIVDRIVADMKATESAPAQG